MKLKILGAVGLICLCFLLFLPGQKSLPPFDRDEARFAQAAKQMVETGDVVDIRFQDQPRHKKPVGIYWLQVLSVKVTGAVDQIWAYRVPSWVGAGVAVVGTAALGALLFTPLTGALAGVVLASTLLLGVEARMAKTDAALLACIVLAQGILARLWMGAGLFRRMDLAFWAALGVGMLIKGPIAPLVVGLTVLPLVVIRRSAAWLKPLGTREGVALAGAIVLPWVLVITLRTHGAFWVESVGQDLLAKAASGQEGHGAPPGYYLVTFFLTFWPWGLFALPAALLAWRQREQAAVQFLVAWIVPTWLVFELMPTKLLHYTLPVFPALALLVASALPVVQTLGRAGRMASLLLLGIVAIGVPLVPPLGFGDPLSFAGLSAGALLVAVGAVAWGLQTTKPLAAGGLFLAGLVNFYVVAFSQTLPHFESFWISRSAAALVAPYRAACPGPVSVLGYAEPSLVFLLGTDSRLVNTLPEGSGCRLVLVAQRVTIPVPDTAEKLGSVSGFNYSKGETVTLTLYRLD